MILHNYEDDDDNDGYYCDIHTYVCMLVSTLSHKPNVCTYVQRNLSIKTTQGTKKIWSL